MANIKDVAKLANVSVTTVSRVLNNKGYISDETRESVRKAMEELDYQPNEVARSLFRRQSNMIGLIIPSVSHPFFAQLTRYIEFYAHEFGYKIVLCNSLMQSGKEREYIELLRRHQVDGIIMGSHTLEIAEYSGLNLPIVSFDRQIAPDIPYVSSDNFTGGVLAGRHLIEKGCKKLAHISGNLKLQMLSNKRNDGFIQACKEYDKTYYIYETDINVLGKNDYTQVVETLFKEHPDIDGIFASSDIIAAQIIKKCTDLGRRVPEDVKIVGYDDTDIAKYLIPAITTIAQPIESMARYAIDYVIKQIEGEVVPNEIVLPITLRVRGTT